MRNYGTMMLAGFAALTAAVAVAAKIPIDNRFILDGERQLRGWTFNEVQGFKPYGTAKEVMLEGVPGVRLVSAGKPTQFYAEVTVPVKPGEKYRVSAKVRGNGYAMVGFFLYGPNWEWRGSTGERFKPAVELSATPCEVCSVLTVAEGVTKVRPQFCCADGGTVDFFDLAVEKLEE